MVVHIDIILYTEKNFLECSLFLNKNALSFQQRQFPLVKEIVSAKKSMNLQVVNFIQSIFSFYFAYFSCESREIFVLKEVMRQQTKIQK